MRNRYAPGRCFALIIILLITGSCSEKKERPPIPLKEMQLLMVDIHMAEAYSVGKYPDSLKKKFDKNPDSLGVYYAIVLRHHNIRLDQFKAAISWYKQHPEMLDTLYNKVLDRVNEMQAEQDKKETATNKKNQGTDTAHANDTSFVKKQRDSLRLNRRTFRQRDISQ